MAKRAKLGDGLYQREGSDIYYMRYSVAGRIVRKSTGTNKISIAQDIYEKAIRERDANEVFQKYGVGDGGNKKIADLCNDYAEYRKQKGIYNDDVKYKIPKMAEFFANKKIQAVIARDIQAYAKLWNGPTRNRNLATLGAFFTYCANEGYISAATLQQHRREICKMKECENEAREYFLDEEELKLLLIECKKAPDFLYPLVLSAVALGQRRGKILGMTWDDIDWDNGIVYFPKNRKKSTKRNAEAVAIVPVLYNVLKNMYDNRKHDKYIFIYKGKPVVEPRESFNAAKKRAGLDEIHFHDLRHSFASFLSEDDVPTSDIQSALGHSTPLMTQRYVHRRIKKLHRIVSGLEDRLQKAVS